MLLLLDSYQWARTLTTCNKNSNEVVREDTTYWVRPLIRACKDLRAKNYDTNPQKKKKKLKPVTKIVVIVMFEAGTGKVEQFLREVLAASQRYQKSPILRAGGDLDAYKHRPSRGARRP